MAERSSENSDNLRDFLNALCNSPSLQLFEDYSRRFMPSYRLVRSDLRNCLLNSPELVETIRAMEEAGGKPTLLSEYWDCYLFGETVQPDDRNDITYYGAAVDMCRSIGHGVEIMDDYTMPMAHAGAWGCTRSANEYGGTGRGVLGVVRVLKLKPGYAWLDGNFPARIGSEPVDGGSGSNGGQRSMITFPREQEVAFPGRIVFPREEKVTFPKEIRF